MSYLCSSGAATEEEAVDVFPRTPRHGTDRHDCDEEEPSAPPPLPTAPPLPPLPPPPPPEPPATGTAKRPSQFSSEFETSDVIMTGDELNMIVASCSSYSEENGNLISNPMLSKQKQNIMTIVGNV